MSSHPEPEVRRVASRGLKIAGIVGAAAALAIAAAGLIGRALAAQQLTSWTQAQAIPTVDVIEPTFGGGVQALALPGAVQAFYNASIHARVSGYLKDWRQDIGARVRAGQLLAEIDTPELDQQLARARADLATARANQRLAQTTAARWSALLAQDAVARQEADEKAGDLAAKTSLAQAAKAEVDQLLAQESFKKIVAPFDGVVTARTTDIGALIAAGTPTDPGLFTVSDIHRLRIYVRVPQNYSARIKPGMTATLTVPEYPGRTFQATLTSTSNAVSEQSGALLVELQTDNQDLALKPGDYAMVTFPLSTTPNAATIPASAAILRRNGLAVATIDAHSRVVMRPITVQRDLGAALEVGAGLSLGERIIDNPPDSLRDGDLVRIAGASARRLATTSGGRKG